MFLVNAPPPLASFQAKWAPFGQAAAACRIPATFSESEDDISRAALSTQVQGIISNLHSDESSPEVTGEYEGIMQKPRKGDSNIERGLKSGAAVLKGHTRESATVVVPSEFKDNKDDNSEFGPLTLDSDSDDSVDRDIEEAIQEYLKNKGTGEAPDEGSTKSSSSVAQNAAAVNASPVSMVTTSDVCNSFRLKERQRSASPDSVSSDDSFEQSIKAEIEQFLHEKKQQNSKSNVASPPKVPRVEAPVKPKLKTNKTFEKQNSKQGGSELFQKHVSDSFKCPRPNPETTKTQPKASVPKQNTKTGFPSQKPTPVVAEELSDSSSDDGIEEAIQLYQLEKQRQGITPTVTPEKAKSPGPADLQTDTESRKRKSSTSKPAAFQDISNCQPLLSKRALLYGEERETGVPTTCRAETAAELMCAEAILDISKTILPSQPQSTYVIPTGLAPPPPEPQCDSDSMVDSDDSIEQEIRTFLARKAQEETAGAASVKQEPMTEISLDAANQSPKSKLSLTHKKKARSVQSDLIKKTVPLDKLGSNVEQNKCPQPDERVQSTKCPAKVSAPLDMNVGTGENVVVPEVSNRGRGKHRGLSRSYSSGDKSSSLDSDEDLDTAIKDLLKSKRKYKKRPKDGKSQCKKRVRFSETLSRPLDVSDDSKHPRSPPFVKSCLLNSTAAKENSSEKRKEEKAVVAERNVPSVSASPQCNRDGQPVPACASGELDGKTRGFHDAQDSSSVDSDDSIEQEIRKFLAERARESSTLIATQSETVPCPAEKNNPPVDHKQTVLLNPTPKTVLQPETSKNISTAAPSRTTVVQPLHVGKQPVLPQPNSRHAEAGTGMSPQGAPNCFIIKKECLVENSIIKPMEQCLPTAPGRVIMQANLNSPQHLPVGGNFVAGLKYVSGTEKQLLLNVGNTGPSKLATEICKSMVHNSRLANCPPLDRKVPVLDRSKELPTINIIPKSPLVRSGLYLVTTKVCKENSPSLCLPINTAAYETGINLMSIQYCQVNPQKPPCVGGPSVTPQKSSDSRGSLPGHAGTPPLFITRTREYKAAREGVEREGRTNPNEAANHDLVADAVKNVKEIKNSQEGKNVPSSSDLEPYIVLSPEKYKRFPYGTLRPSWLRESKYREWILPAKAPRGQRKT
uniref:Protein phosphatase 1 regulatory subunit 26 N-terminal domain-containing protein n=1 Tax=Xenopus tropicalis TaxID=8364 RepID=A0A803KKY3_XENTR|eukprot:XP_004916699.1 PREDICTED: protein phosphatase 1 regulatory subunit 26 isoform X1 [Xenopus tropicalis]